MKTTYLRLLFALLILVASSLATGASAWGATSCPTASCNTVIPSEFNACIASGCPSGASVHPEGTCTASNGSQVQWAIVVCPCIGGRACTET